jgi:hypothetical protein
MMQTTQFKVDPMPDNARRLTQKLLEGLMLYRHELGELGQQLELLIRCERILIADQRYLSRIH